jgi:hypothetical protein
MSLGLGGKCVGMVSAIIISTLSYMLENGGACESDVLYDNQDHRLEIDNIHIM